MLSDGELSDSEWLNLTPLTVDGLVNIIDNIEHCHDSGIVHVVRDNRIVDGVNNDSDKFDSQLLNLSRITDDVMLITEDIFSKNNISPWIVQITSRHG